MTRAQRVVSALILTERRLAEWWDEGPSAALGRWACRRLLLHSDVCRGRGDHLCDPAIIDGWYLESGRWVRFVTDDPTAAEQVVAVFDSYSQAEHVEGINEGRKRVQARRDARQDRAQAAPERTDR